MIEERIDLVLHVLIDVLQDESGATIVDYGIVILLLAIAAAAAFDPVGGFFSSMLSLLFAD